MAVSAAEVKELREQTGAPMMDVKNALEEAEGDEQKAIEILRKKGAASAAKRGGRSTSEGVVTSYVHADGRKGENVVEKIVEGQLRKWASELVLLDQKHFNEERYEGKTIEDLRSEIAANTGENVRIARFARFEVGQE